MLATCRAVYPLDHFRPQTIAAGAAGRSGPSKPHLDVPTRAAQDVIAPPLPPAGPPGDGAGQDEAGRQRSQSRWQRLREKMTRMKKEDPNIYPLY